MTDRALQAQAVGMRSTIRRPLWAILVGLLWWPTCFLTAFAFAFAFSALGSRQAWWQIPLGLAVVATAGVSQARTRLELRTDELRVVNGLHRAAYVPVHEIAEIGLGLVPGLVRPRAGVVLELKNLEEVQVFVSRVTSRWRRRELRQALEIWATPRNIHMDLSDDVDWTWKVRNAPSAPPVVPLTKVQRRRLWLLTVGLVLLTLLVGVGVRFA